MVGTLARDLLATLIFLAISISWGDCFKRSILDQTWTVSSRWRVSPVIAYLNSYRVTFFKKFEVDDPAGYAKSTVEWFLIPWKAF